jgi:hypothetical protein
MKILIMLNKHLNQSIRRLIVKLLGGARDQGLQSLSVMISLFISWMTLLISLSRHLHLLMQMIGKKWSIVRWTQFSLIKLWSWLIDYMAVNPWVVSECLKRSLSQMVLLISTKHDLWPRVILKRKTKISLIIIHLLLD